ncbi:MAG: PEP-CTERM sorting domain-containing protein [bacterium]
MKIYKEKQSQPLRWVIALVIFILTMTITFADVYGLGVPSGKYNPPPNRTYYNSQSGTTTPIFDINTPNYDGYEKCPPPSDIPEPISMILMGMGLAALHMANRKRKI